MLRYLTAGESHGKALLAILEGMPAGLKVGIERINQELKHRQQGYGRGKRMRIEKDKAEILSGLKNGLTLGSPIGILIKNKDFSIEKLPKVICPRPGHADLAGVLKYGFSDVRNVLERASARETAARVAIGAICKMLLEEFGISITSRVLEVGGREDKGQIKAVIDEARKKKDTLGGIFEVRARNVIAGLGSYVHPDRRLDSRLAQIIMSIPGVKAVQVGLGFGYADELGSHVHDVIRYSKNKGFYRETNNAGGIEGGISNGEDILLHACMKPISTLLAPLDSVNIKTRAKAKASIERSDICVVQAAGVVAEAAVAFELAKAVLSKFGSDALTDIKVSYRNYLKRLR
ncbi:MAG: chorismate synthase [Candidatus Omnitrophota bacterium]